MANLLFLWLIFAPTSITYIVVENSCIEFVWSMPSWNVIRIVSGCGLWMFCLPATKWCMRILTVRFLLIPCEVSTEMLALHCWSIRAKALPLRELVRCHPLYSFFVFLLNCNKIMMKNYDWVRHKQRWVRTRRRAERNLESSSCSKNTNAITTHHVRVGWKKCFVWGATANKTSKSHTGICSSGFEDHCFMYT